MTQKYCPYCKTLGKTMVMPDYEQIPWRGIMVKKRKVAHMIEDGGCGRTWYTAELPYDMLDQDTDDEDGDMAV